MTIFAILMPSPQPALVEAIKAAYPADFLEVSPTQWLISSRSTVNEVSNKIGVTSLAADHSPKGIAIIFATSSYFGRAPQTVWDWIKIKLESPPSG
jgi:hypothetical protein